MNLLGVYADVHGFGVNRFTYSNDVYQIDTIEHSPICSLDRFTDTISKLVPIKTAYTNASKLANHGLYKLGLQIISTDIPDEYDKESPFNLRDCHEIITSLLNDNRLIFKESVVKNIRSDLSGYVIGDNNHTVLALFFGIGIHAMNEQINFRRKGVYLSGNQFEGSSIAHW
jgi:hypothetical protein